MATRIETEYTKRAKYYDSIDGFNITRAAVPPHVFRAERERAMAPGASTELVPLDLSATLGTRFPATTPLILARYARIRAAEHLDTRFVASGELYYVIHGAGESRAGDDHLAWEAGDIFTLPGGRPAVHSAARDTVFWVVTNEPELAFERAQAPAPGRAPLPVVHYPADEIRRQLDAIHRRPDADALPGKSINFGVAGVDEERTILPSFTLAMNSLAPGDAQRAHRHNAIAVTLVVQGAGCYSMIDGTRIDWEQDAVVITPPGASHSHHNGGGERALFLIVQDGGLHYHCRTMGFSFT
jgi:quercetin dioxygenase-like cupin family protein